MKILPMRLTAAVPKKLSCDENDIDSEESNDDYGGTDYSSAGDWRK